MDQVKIETCKCGVQIMKVEHHKTGKRAPIEVQPTADGNILVTGKLYEVVPVKERGGLIKRGFELRKNHYATCPFAQEFR